MALTGVVRKWMPEKGIGFIQGPGGLDGADVFVHHSQIVAPDSAAGGRGFLSLTVGGTVRYDVRQNDGKTAAVNVQGALGPRLDMKDPQTAHAVASGQILLCMDRGKGGKAGGKGSKGVTMGRGSGWVRKWDEEKGYGFISCDAGSGPDLFTHVKALAPQAKCPHCEKHFAVKTRMPHRQPVCPDVDFVQGGDVEYEIELGQDGKYSAVGLTGVGDNPGLVVRDTPVAGRPAGGAPSAVTHPTPPQSCRYEPYPQPERQETPERPASPDRPEAPDLPGEPDEPQQTYECSACETHFSATPGSLVHCPGCEEQVQV